MLGSEPSPTYVWTRFLFLRGLALMYLVAFLIAANQLVPLVGEDGILPARWYLDDLRFAHGSTLHGFVERPTLFWLDVSDAALRAVSWIGVALSAAMLLGLTHAGLTLALWFLYMSVVHVGQVFYGYGWEMLLLEVGFLAVFLCPVRSVGPLRTASPPHPFPIWLLRWVVFRLMFGAGLIKVKPLLADDPFPHAPPRWIRARLYRYEMTSGGPDWWRRRPVALYLRPLSLEDPAVIEFLRERGLLRDEGGALAAPESGG